MTIKILNEIPEMPGYCRVEENHKISIKRKEDVEKMQEENKPKLSKNSFGIIIDTLCGFPFDKESYGCRTCDNIKYCKEEENKNVN